MPLIGQYLQDACEKKQKLEVLEKELSGAATRIMFLGGSIPPFAEVARKKAEREQLAANLQEAIT